MFFEQQNPAETSMDDLHLGGIGGSGFEGEEEEERNRPRGGGGGSGSGAKSLFDAAYGSRSIPSPQPHPNSR